MDKKIMVTMLAKKKKIMTAKLATNRENVLVRTFFTSANHESHGKLRIRNFLFQLFNLSLGFLKQFRTISVWPKLRCSDRQGQCPDDQ